MHLVRPLGRAAALSACLWLTAAARGSDNFFHQPPSEQKGGLTRAWLRRLSVFHEAGWDTHIATIHPQPEIDETLAAWRARGWLPAATSVHHYQRRDRRFRPSWRRPTDASFTRAPAAARARRRACDRGGERGWAVVRA